MSDLAMTMAAAGDASVISDLLRRCFAEVWDEDSVASLLAGPGAFALLAMRRGRPCGYALLRVIAGEGEILSMAIDPLKRRYGIGGRLLAAALAEARRRGAMKVFLEVAVDNPAARRLYAAAGFAVIGRRQGYYRPAGGDALVMAAALDAGGPT